MAIMHPFRVPDEVRRDPYREAEVAVFERLRDQLPGDYHCYYSRPWLGLTPTGEEKEGEADFVVAHPAKGFLVIEVKGGAVSRRGDTDEWTSKNRLGITNRIKDPVKQASVSKHALLAKLKEQPDWRARFVTARHGVVLPDCSRPRQSLGASMPLFLFAFAEDLNYLAEWVEARLGRTDSEADDPGRGLGPDGMRAMHRLLAADFELRPSLARALREDGREIERLTREQYELLGSLEDIPQMAVSGGAGTGKTLLALEKACRLGEAGQRVLLTCFNEALGAHLARLTSGFPSLTVASFHSLCARMAHQAGSRLPSGGGSQTFATELPDALLTAVTQREDLRFDAVVVDEGQDFRDNWLTALRLCLRDPDGGTFYVFHDDNQKVYSHSGGWLLELPRSQYPLTRNLRNTKTIHLCAKPWYKGRATRSAGPDGMPVEWVEVKWREDVPARVRSALADLAGRQRIPPAQIAVLTAARTDGHPLCSGGTIGGLRCGPAGGDPDDGVVFDTVRRFKGLDRPVIMLCDVEELTEPELIYVALSRPSVLLMVFGTAPALARLRDGPGNG